MSPPPDRTATIEQLAERIRGLEGKAERGTGSPGEGDDFAFAPGTLVEWVAETAGSGIATLALRATLPRLDRDDDRPLVLVDPAGTLHPPALADLDLDRLLVVRPADEAEALWAGEQAMRCPGVALTLLTVDRLRSTQGRRLQLALEHGRGIGLLLRPWRAQREACWADVRFLVRPRAPDSLRADRRWQIEVAYQRGAATAAGSLEVVLDHETGRVHLVPELAPATSTRRAS